jgi:hypothetical protein
MGRVKFDFLKEIGSGRVESGYDRVNLYIVFFFRSLIDFDWIEGHLILGRVRIRSNQFIFFLN